MWPLCIYGTARLLCPMPPNPGQDDQERIPALCARGNERYERFFAAPSGNASRKTKRSRHDLARPIRIGRRRTTLKDDPNALRLTSFSSMRPKLVRQCADPIILHMSSFRLWSRAFSRTPADDITRLATASLTMCPVEAISRGETSCIKTDLR